MTALPLTSEDRTSQDWEPKLIGCASSGTKDTGSIDTNYLFARNLDGFGLIWVASFILVVHTERPRHRIGGDPFLQLFFGCDSKNLKQGNGKRTPSHIKVTTRNNDRDYLDSSRYFPA